MCGDSILLPQVLNWSNGFERKGLMGGQNASVTVKLL